MKFLPLFWLLFAAVSALNQNLARKLKQEVMTSGSQCAQQEKVGENDMARFMAHKLPKTHEGFCAISCVEKHFGLQNEDGTFEREGLEKLLKPLKDDEKELYNIGLNIFDENCSKLPFGEDHCENAMKIIECFVKEGEKQGLTPELIGL